MTNNLRAALIAVAIVSAPSGAIPQAAIPAAIFVTWNGDPTTSVSVDWHLVAGSDIPALELRRPGTAKWTRYNGTSFDFPYSTRKVRRAQIEGLRPGTTYELRIGDSRIYKYRTLPARLTRTLRFATGGDTQADEARLGRLNRIAAARDVDFVVYGGDLAYSDGDPRLVSREETWFETITNTLVTEEGRLIPVIAAIGNHEVFSSRDTTGTTQQMIRETGVKRGEAPYFSVLHANASPPHYRVIDVGNYLSLVLLNTDHTAPVAGAQTVWLDSVLARRTRVPHVFPIYHVPAYPSVRSFDGTTSAQVREHWAPLFEQFGVRVAFENHEHAYKRTFPITAGQRDTSGVVYVGDGAWGSSPRPLGRGQKTRAWYVQTSQSANHGIFVTLEGRTAHFDVVHAAGTQIDAWCTTSQASGTDGKGVGCDDVRRWGRKPR